MVVLGAGLTFGAFTSRFLAENYYHTLAGLSSLPQTALLSLAVALALLTFWRLYSALCVRQAKIPLNQALADDALTYVPLFLLLLYLSQKEVNLLQAKVLPGGSVLLVMALKVKALLRRKTISQRWPLGLRPGAWNLRFLSALFVLTFIVYLSTLSPTLGEADSFEFQVVSYTLGIAHPSGYPLYILLGKLFTFLPLGNVAYRVNLVSPLFASLAVVCLYLCLVHLTQHRAISLLAALTFAFSRTFWSQAVIAEVYTLNAFFVALVFYLLLKGKVRSTNGTRLINADRPTMKSSGYRAAPHQWGSNPATSDKSPIHRALLRSWATSSPSGLTAFIYGLSLTNHLTMALLAPAMAIYVLLTKRRPFTNMKKVLPTMSEGLLTEFPSPRSETFGDQRAFGLWALNFGLLLGLFLLGLSAYLYIPLRGPALHGRSIALSEFVNWVLGSRFQGALHWDAWLTDPERYHILGRLILQQYGWVGLMLGLLGLVWLFTKRRREAILLLTAYVAYFIYGLNYYVPDISAFIIPAHLIFAIWIGAGLHALWQAASSWTLDSLLITCFSLLITLPLLWTNLPQVDMSQHGWEAYRWGEYVLGLDIAPGAAILADSEKIAPLYYLQRVEGMRPDLDIIVMGDEAGYRQQLETRIAQGQTVYLARYLPGLEGRFLLRSLGPLVEVGTTPLTSTVRSPKSEVRSLKSDGFGQNIRLLGYDADSLDIKPPDQLRLTLFWQAVDRIDTNYHVRLRLVSESGHVWLEEEGRHPVNGYYPTVAWRPGEVVPDFHELPISKALPPGPYRLEVGLFPPFGQESVFAAQISQVHVLKEAGWESPEDWAIPYPLRATFNDELILLGYDRPSLTYPNGQATLTLYWQRLRQGAGDYNVALQLVDEAGNVLWQENVPPLFGEYPTSHWGVGQIMQTSHELPMPATEGKVGLRVGLSLPDSSEMLPVRSHWLAPLSEWCPLRPIQVRSVPLAGGPAINFDNRILLLGYSLDQRQLRPGETLELSLTWQCLQRMAEDYTVFVHVLDKEQHIWGQEDVWPVHGTYPTSQWKEGEIIEDTHSVRLSYDAPPGEYQIEIGLYLLSTMARLPVLDEEMRVIDDKVIVGEIMVAP
jgi:hypothetical protein